MDKKIAENLLDIKAVFLNVKEPFTWASGIKSPIYCNNRLTLSYVEVRNNIEKALSELILKRFPECEMLMGTATAGIAHAAICADILKIPMGYVRDSAKDHGRVNQIEGKFSKGCKIVVIEDLISTAGSCIDVVNHLRSKGADVLGIASIFTYNMKKSFDRLRENDVVNYSISSLDTLLDVALEKEYIDEVEKTMILQFRNNPQDESWICRSH